MSSWEMRNTGLHSRNAGNSMEAVLTSQVGEGPLKVLLEN